MPSSERYFFLNRYIALELCSASLKDWAESATKSYAGNVPHEWLGLQQMSHGLEFIHSNKHVHRDISPDNILISKDGHRLLISDFGLCKKTSVTGSFTVSLQLRGKEMWMAPELVAPRSDDKPNRGTVHADTYSMGCVFFYFLNKGGHPYRKDGVKTENANFGR